MNKNQKYYSCISCKVSWFLSLTLRTSKLTVDSINAGIKGSGLMVKWDVGLSGWVVIWEVISYAAWLVKPWLEEVSGSIISKDSKEKPVSESSKSSMYGSYHFLLRFLVLELSWRAQCCSSRSWKASHFLLCCITIFVVYSSKIKACTMVGLSLYFTVPHLLRADSE